MMALSPTEIELIKAAMNLGTLFVVFLAMLYLGYRLALHAGPGIVKYAAAFIAAQEKQAAAISEVKDAIRDYVTTDNDEHREILLGLQVLAKMMEELKTAVEEK
jgi:hypothetical protein